MQNVTNQFNVLVSLLAVFLGMAVVFVFSVKPLLRFLAGRVMNEYVSILLTDKYSQNIGELLPSLKRYSLLNVLEMSLRAETGQIIARPLGSPKHFLGFENLMFSPRQMACLPFPANAPVDMSVTLGPGAARPMKLRIPLMIASMAYGLALSEEAKQALAKASAELQTAIGSGEGPVLPEEGDWAGKYILQISRWSWGLRTLELIAKADMLEVQMGQGADMGAAPLPAAELAGKAARLGGLMPGASTESLPAPPGVGNPQDWPEFLKLLRYMAEGIPIALKLMATDHLEEDLAIAVKLGFDAVILDGAQGGSHASPPIKQDDFGIPSLYALIRARRFLADQPVSLIVSGGYFTPGQCLKALALGADAIYLGTVPLFALAHRQAEKVAPWEPLTTLVYYESPDKGKLDVALAQKNVVNVIKSMELEMAEALRALGKTSLQELSDKDLVALDSTTAEVTGVKRAY